MQATDEVEFMPTVATSQKNRKIRLADEVKFLCSAMLSDLPRLCYQLILASNEDPASQGARFNSGPAP